MIFLGQASNYSSGRVLRHLFAHGNVKDSEQLKIALAKRYKVEKSSSYEPEERVELYHTGRSALAAAILSVAPKGSRVIIPGLTCIAVVRAVRAAGCEPVFVDIDPETLQYDWDKLIQVLEKAKLEGEKSSKVKNNLDKTLKVCYNVSTIVAQNTLGLPLDVSKLEQIAKKYHLEIVEDLAHCAGRFYADGREIGSVGAATALSFGKGKAIDTISGGALVLRQAKYAMPSPPRFRAKRSARWRERWYPALGTCIRAGYHVKLGKIFTAVFLKLGWIERSADAELNLDVKLSNWQAKLALRQLDQLHKSTLASSRRSKATPKTSGTTPQQQTSLSSRINTFSEGTKDLAQAARTAEDSEQRKSKAFSFERHRQRVTQSRQRPEEKSIYAGKLGPLREHYFVKQRDKLLAECATHGFYLGEIWYDTPVSPVRYKKEVNFPAKDCPNTVAIAKTIINLPTWYPEEKLTPVRELIQPYLIGVDELLEQSKNSMQDTSSSEMLKSQNKNATPATPHGGKHE